MQGEKNESFPKRKKNFIIRRAVAAALVLMMVGSPFTPIYSGLNDRISIVASADETENDVLMTVNGTEVKNLSDLDSIIDSYEDEDLEIILSQNVSLDDAKSLLYLKSHQNITLNLNGHTFTTSQKLIIDNTPVDDPITRTLNIIGDGDSKIIYNGSEAFICLQAKQKGNYDNCVLNFNDGVTVDCGDAYCVTMESMGGNNKSYRTVGFTINVNDATLKSNNAVFYVAENLKAQVEDNDASVINIKSDVIGGTFGVYQGGYCFVNVIDGTINADTPIYSRTGKTNITGGEIKATGNNRTYEFTEGIATPTGDAVVVEDHSLYVTKPVLSVSGGTIISENSKTIAAYPSKDNVTVSLTGGRYLAPDVRDTNVEELLTDDYTLTGDAYVSAKADIIAEINGIEYKTINTAFDYAKDGDTIKIVKNCTESTMNLTIPNGKNLILDFNKKTITLTESNFNLAAEGTTGSLKITNGTLKDAMVKVGKNVNLTVDDGMNITSPENTYAITGDKIESSNSQVTVKEGAVIQSTNESAIFWPNDGTLNIEGGSITGPTAVYASTGTVNISGGTFTANGEKKDPNLDDNKPQPTGDAIVIQSFTELYGNAPIVNISGGTFISEKAEPVASYAKNSETDVAPTKFVSGGKYSKEVLEELLADKKVNRPEDDGFYYVVDFTTEKVDFVDADCFDKEGNYEYYYGSDKKPYQDADGSTLFEDKNGDGKSNLDDTVIKAGHVWGQPTYTWSEDGKTCTAKVICDRDNEHVVTEEAEISSKVETPPTFDSKGKTEYTATFKNNETGLFETKTKVVENIDARIAVATVNGNVRLAMDDLNNTSVLDALGDDITIVLNQDVVLDDARELLNLKKHSNIVLDTNGFTFSTKERIKYYNTVEEGNEEKTRTITFTGNGKVEYTGKDAFVSFYDDNNETYDKFVVNFKGSVTLEAPNDAYGVLVNKNGNKGNKARGITVNVGSTEGSKISDKKATIKCSYGALYVNGTVNQLPDESKGEEPVTFNIVTYGTVSDYDNTNSGIYQAGYSVINVLGGTVSGGTGIYSKSGIINIEKGNVKGLGEASEFIPYGNGAYYTGDAIVVEDNPSYPIKPKVYIKGGTVKSTNAKAVKAYKAKKDESGQWVEDSNPPEVDIEISGGYIQIGSAGDFDAKKYLVEGKDMTYNGFVTDAEKIAAVNERTGLKYSTPSLAVSQAEDGDTIKFLNNYGTKPTLLNGRDSLSIKEGKNVTIDLDGHSYTLNLSDRIQSSAGCLTISSNDATGNTTLTIKNGTINASIGLNKNANLVLGENLTLNSYDDYYAVASNHNTGEGASLTVKEGAVLNSKNACTIYWPQDGTLNIEGGTITGPTAVYARTGTINITGGNFVANGEKKEPSLTANGASATGDAVVIQSYSKSYGHAPIVTITGGNFKSVNADPVATYAASASDVTPKNFLSGGTYSKEVKFDDLDKKYMNAENDGSGEEYKVIPIEFTHVEEVKPKCTKTGNIEHYTGSNGLYYKDNQGTLVDDKNNDGKIDIADVTVDATGHHYNTPTYIWNADHSQCTATAVCKDDEYVLTEEVNAEIVTTPAQCAIDGSRAYTAVFTNEVFETQRVEIANLPAIGHKWENPTYKWSADGKTCIATATCANDSDHILTEIADITSKVKTPATCEENGTMTYTAMFKNRVFETQTNDVANIPKLDHEYGEPQYNWSADCSEVTATVKCKNCDDVITETVATTSRGTKAATCEEKGTTTYTAMFTNDLFERQTKSVDNIPATGHKYEKPEYIWSKDNKTVTAKVVCDNDISHVVVETAETSSKIKTEATCETAGTTTYTVTFNNELFEDQTKDVDDIPATGHKYGKPTYTWSADNKTVTATVVCENDASHEITETVDVKTTVKTPATCETAGTTTYTATFENELFEDQTKDLEDIAAIGHKYGKPTYTWSADNKTVAATVVCENDAGHEITETVNVKTTIKTPATCETAGTTTYTATFENELFEDQTKDLEDIAAIGHKYGKPTYTWSADKKTVTATAVCENDASHVVTETVNTTSKGTKAATCEENGTTTYTAMFTNDLFERQTESVDNIPATGHSYGVPVYVWSEDNKTVTATVVCQNDATHVVTETQTTTSKIVKNASCDEHGQTKYTATFNNNLFSEQTKTVSDILPTGHKYGTPVYTWSEDGKTCTAKVVCKDDSNHVITERADITSAINNNPTCTAKGTTKYTATFKLAPFTTQTKTIEDIPAKGHKYGTPTYTWSADGKTCTARAVCANDATHVVTENAVITSKVQKAATCDEKGITKYTATFSNGLFDTQTKNVEDISSIGHKYGQPTYKWSADNKTVTATVVCDNDVDHVITETVNTTSVEKTPATCETKGTTTYTAKFTNELFTEQTKDVEDIKAVGHKYSKPTYEWSKDNKTVTATAVCENDSSHVVTETVNVTTKVKKAATCEEDGITTYTAIFANDMFTKQTKDETDISAIGHKYGEPTYKWSADNKTVTATVVCDNDESHIVTETVEAVSVVKTPATCETKGTTTYTAKFTNELFTEQTKDVEDIKAVGHKYSKPTYQWSKDNKTVTATAVCENDEKHNIVETVNATSKVKNAATCEAKGTTTYTAIFANDMFTKQTKDVTDIPATGHKYGEPTYKWSADNKTVTATVVCDNDESHVITETVEAASVVKTPATCDTKGTTTYTAKFTNELFKEQAKDVEDISANEHKYSEPTYQWSKDNKTVTATAVCENDEKHNIVETVNATSKVKKAATCDAKGTTTYTAIFANDMFTKQTKDVTDIPATGHKYGEPTYKWSADNKTVTATVVCDNDESHVVTETVEVASVVKTPATCDTKGTTSYTATFKNKQFAKQTKDVEDIAAIGHKYGKPTYKWSEDGKTCIATAVCENDKNHVLTEAADITSVVTAEPTCDTMGKITYTATFKFRPFKQQTKEVEAIQKINHDYGEPTYTGSADGKTCTATAVCKNDKDHVLTEIAEVTSNVKKAATCEENGTTTYTAVFKLRPFTQQTKDVEDIPATGHKYGEAAYTWSEDGKTCTATVVCANDSKHVLTEEATVTSEVKTPATADTNGTTTYTASFENPAFASQKKDVDDIPATGEKTDTPDPTKPDTPDPEKPKRVYGDVDGDGKVTARDSLLLQRYALKLADLDDISVKVADVNNDGKATASDALTILRYTIKAKTNGRTGENYEG